MAGYPNKPQISFSYTGFQASLGDNSFPGTNIDNDLASLTQFASTTVDFLKLFANSDGSLKFSAIPQTAQLATYTQSALDAASAAAVSQSNAAASASAAATSAGNAAASALAASTTLSSALKKASNLSDLADAPTARTNLGLGSFATKSSIVLADFGANFFTADATGRGKFASGFVTNALIADGAVDNAKIATGAVVQVVRSETGAVNTSAVIIPNDDTIPQNTEGAALTALNTTITPKSATNILIVEVLLYVNPNTTATAIAALFKDAETSARAVGSMSIATSNAGFVSIRYQMVAGSTTATTFSVRYGPNVTATITVNGVGAARFFGGTMLSYMQITEIKA